MTLAVGHISESLLTLTVSRVVQILSSKFIWIDTVLVIIADRYALWGIRHIYQSRIGKPADLAAHMIAGWLADGGLQRAAD